MMKWDVIQGLETSVPCGGVPGATVNTRGRRNEGWIEQTGQEALSAFLTSFNKQMDSYWF